MRKSIVHAVIILALASLLAVPAQAGEHAESNLLFSIAVVDTGSEGQVVRRSSRILALAGSRADLSAGWRIPIPTQTTAAGEGDGSVTSFSYQDVGLLARVDGRILGEGRVQANGRIEVSSVEPGTGAATGHSPTPTIAHFSQMFDVILEDGVEVTLAEAPGPGGGSRSLEISASIQP